MGYLVGGDALARDAALVLRAGVRDDLKVGSGVPVWKCTKRVSFSERRAVSGYIHVDVFISQCVNMSSFSTLEYL